jgi:hypothetical protein
VAPLLTGFSLTTITLLLTAKSTPPLADWATVALALAVACLLFSMQVAFLALARSPSPAEILIWKPEVTISADALEVARAEQAANMADVKRLWKWYYAPTYDLGVVAFLAGLLLLLIPHLWSAPRIAAVAIAGSALILEAWWTLANRISYLPHPVIKDPPPSDFREGLAPLNEVGRAAVLHGLPQEPASGSTGAEPTVPLLLE